MTNKIKMQKEHDATISKKETVAPKTIMDALNWFKGEVPTLVGAGGVLVECIRMHYGCPLDVVGGIYAGGGGFDDKHFRQVCTKEEYEALVEELSRPEKEEFKIYTQAMADAGELPEAGMGCMVLSRELHNAEFERCTILFIGEFWCVYTSDSCKERVANMTNNSLIFKPIDNRTEKEKVIDGITDLVDRVVNEGECTNVVVEAIYDNYIGGLNG